MGVWIETLAGNAIGASSQSHPAWVCGLKLGDTNYRNIGVGVTPCVGVWIETLIESTITIRPSHTLRGCVD